MKKTFLGIMLLSLTVIGCLANEVPRQAEVKQETTIINLASCKGCHGVKWEKSALGKSKIIKDLTKKEIETAILGYKEGTYGGVMKGVMKGQLSQYKTIEDIQILIDEIDTQIHPETEGTVETSTK